MNAPIVYGTLDNFNDSKWNVTAIVLIITIIVCGFLVIVILDHVKSCYEL